jgi:preprotein translocase subunit SecB
MRDMRSRLVFEGYRVHRLTFQSSAEFSFSAPVAMDFHVYKDVSMAPDDPSRSTVRILVDIFDKAALADVPFRMHVEVDGTFRVEPGDDDTEAISPKLLMERNAPAILFPFVRSVVASITAAANVPPFVLPVLNINHVPPVNDRHECEGDRPCLGITDARD